LLLQLAKEGVASVDHVRAYLRASEIGRTFLQKYFNLQVPLLYQFTHLVCREALQGKDSHSYPESLFASVFDLTFNFVHWSWSVIALLDT
jgi:hypothetical protein